MMHQLTDLAIAQEGFWTSMTVNGVGRGSLSKGSGSNGFLVTVHLIELDKITRHNKVLLKVEKCV